MRKALLSANYVRNLAEDAPCSADVEVHRPARLTCAVDHWKATLVVMHVAANDEVDARGG